MDLTNRAIEISVQKIVANGNLTGYIYSGIDYLPPLKQEYALILIMQVHGWWMAIMVILMVSGPMDMSIT